MRLHIIMHKQHCIHTSYRIFLCYFLHFYMPLSKYQYFSPYNPWQSHTYAAPSLLVGHIQSSNRYHYSVLSCPNASNAVLSSYRTCSCSISFFCFPYSSIFAPLPAVTKERWLVNLLLNSPFFPVVIWLWESFYRFLRNEDLFTMSGVASPRHTFILFVRIL